MKNIDTKKITVSLQTKDGDKVILVNMMDAPKSIHIDDVSRNVFRLDLSGDVVWQIGNYNPFPNSTFTNIYYDNSGQLKGYNFDGGEYLIDLDTGRVKSGQLIK